MCMPNEILYSAYIDCQRGVQIMKYGIEIYEMDETPGCRDSGYLPTEWFTSKKARDSKYDKYMEEDKIKSPDEILIEMEHPNYIYYQYTKIDKPD